MQSAAEVPESMRLQSEGRALVGASDWLGASCCFHQAIQCLCSATKDDEERIWCNLSLCHARMGQWAASEGAARRAILLNATYVKALYRLACALQAIYQAEEDAQQSQDRCDCCTSSRGPHRLSAMSGAREACLAALGMHWEATSFVGGTKPDRMSTTLVGLLRAVTADTLAAYVSVVRKVLPNVSIVIQLHPSEVRLSNSQWAVRYARGGMGLGKGVFAGEAAGPMQPVAREAPIVWQHIQSCQRERKDASQLSFTCEQCMRRVVIGKNLCEVLVCDVKGNSCPEVQRSLAAILRLLPGSQPVPCRTESCTMQFCSSECEIAAWQGDHALLCPMLHDGLLGLISTCQAGQRTNPLLVAKMMARICMDEARQARESRFSWPKSAFLGVFENFVSRPEESDEDETFVALIKTQLLATCASQGVPASFIDLLVTLPSYRRLEGMVQQNAQKLHPVTRLQILWATELSLAEKSVMARDLSKLGWDPDALFGLLCSGNEATSMLHLGNCMNHSCDPNVFAACGDEVAAVQFVSLRSIQGGEELTRSYIDETLPFAQRQATLQRLYGFECCCRKCQLRQ